MIYGEFMKTETFFTIPADFKTETIKEFAELNKTADVKLGEVYGSIKTYEIGSGRKFSLIPDVKEKELSEYVKCCIDNGIRFNYTLNLSCANNDEFTKEGIEKFLGEIRKLISMGINDFTITLPGLIELFQENFPDVNITFSVISGIDSTGKMEEFCKFNNVKSLYINERAYRQIDMMKKLINVAHKNNKKVGMIINSFCLVDCMYRQQHYDLAAHSTNNREYLIPDYYRAKCALKKITDKKSVLMSPWIRPDDMQRYIDMGVDKFKVTGREMLAGGDMIKVFKIYNSKHYKGNLVDLFMCFDKCLHSDVITINNDENLDNYLKDVYEGKNECSRFGCVNCLKCENALKSIQYNEKEQKKWIDIFEEQMKNYKKNIKI